MRYLLVFCLSSTYHLVITWLCGVRYPSIMCNALGPTDSNKYTLLHSVTSRWANVTALGRPILRRDGVLSILYRLLTILYRLLTILYRWWWHSSMMLSLREWLSILYRMLT